MTRQIHIHAKCNAWEIFKQLPEEKAFKELVKIRNTFAGYKNKQGKLVVKTKIVNPTLFSV